MLVLIAVLTVLVITGILFVLNGLVLCHGNTARSGMVVAAAPSFEQKQKRLIVRSCNVVHSHNAIQRSAVPGSS